MKNFFRKYILKQNYLIVIGIVCCHIVANAQTLPDIGDACPLGECNSGVCYKGICVICGNRGQPCCQGNACFDQNHGSRCVSGFCSRTEEDDFKAGYCGYPGHPPCIDPYGAPVCMMRSSLDLSVASICLACGELGEPCCVDPGFSDPCNSGTCSPWPEYRFGRCTKGENHDERCRKILVGFDQAHKVTDVARCRSFVEQAKVEQCYFYQDIWQRLQGLEQYLQQSLQLCNQIHADLQTAAQANDINRFRGLLEQAKQRNCDFCQRADEYLQKWIQRSHQDPASQAERDALLNEIAGYKKKWREYWGAMSKGGGAFYLASDPPADWLRDRVSIVRLRSDLDDYRQILYCFDPLQMSYNLTEQYRAQLILDCKKRFNK